MRIESHSNSTEDNFAERIRFWRVSQRFNQSDAAKQLDIDRSYLSQIERGRLPGNALRTRFLLMEKASSPSIGVASPLALRSLPVLSWGQAGEMIDLGDIPRNGNDWVPSDVADVRAFGVRLHGDSMEPKYSESDIAVLLPGVAPTNGDTVVANLKNQGVMCKIMPVQLDKNLVKLSSYNPAYPPTEYRRDEFHWIFPVATIIRQLRRG
jgi:SOS-response transcriptional repressor LexA